MPAKTAEASAGIVRVAGSEAAYGLRFIRQQGRRILLVFLGVLLPLLVFAALVDELREGNVFFFDAPLLLGLHQLATPAVDRFFMVVSKLGYHWGVVPLDLGVIAWLVWRRHFRDGLFFGLAVGGAAILNLAAKDHFTRIRPELWLSLAPETTFSFPSGHAMGSAALGVALTMMLWRTHWRWPVAAAAFAFIGLVGLSRVYLGVHYPSDILAGWTAGTAWVVAMHQLVAHRAPKPPSTREVPAAPDLIVKSTQG